MDREKLNKAAMEYSGVISNSYAQYVTNQTLEYECNKSFQNCASWLMKQPLYDRLTDEEKEQIRNYHRVLTRDKSVAICNRSYDGIAGADAMLFSLEQIFGSDLFKEK